MQNEIRCPFCKRMVGMAKGTDDFYVTIKKEIHYALAKGYVCTICSRCDKKYYILLEFKN